MPRIRTTLALAAAALLAAAAPAMAAEHQVTVVDSSFQPRDLTIQVGDTVTWTNTGFLAHNVRASNGSFRCANGCDGQGGNGALSSAGWSFSLTFNDPASITYFCEAHGTAAGFGMAGTITVEGASNDEPGSLRLSNSGTTVTEGGTAIFTVQRVGGDDGPVSVQFATGGGSATAGSDYTAKSGGLTWADNDDDPRNFTVQTIDDGATEPNETVTVSLSNPGGGATLGSPSSATLTILDNDQSSGGAGSLAFTDDEVSVGEGDGSAAVGVNRSGGSSGAVSAGVSTSDGSATAGQDYTAIGTTVSFGDGESGSKDVSVPILDDGTEESNETFNLALSSPTGGATLGSPSAATVTVLDDDLPTFPCVEDDFTLCLLDDRFLVRVDFRPPGGELQQAHRIPFTNRAGLFWFFNPQNVEMLVKMQDACGPFDRFWVFLAATTNVEYRVQVVDTEAGMQQEYLNPQGTAAAPVQDTQAFATCP